VIQQETPPSRRETAKHPDAAAHGIVARVSAWFSSQPRAVLAAGAGVIVVALGAGAVAAGAASNRGPEASIAIIEEDAAARVVPEAAAAPTRARTCTVETADPAFATLAASVVNAATGEQLYSRDAGEPAASLALHKVLTAAVAIHVLGPDTRIATRVYEGSVKGSVVLVGGGDATLSRLPAGAESVYAGAPKLSDLAAQTTASLERLYPREEPERRDDDDDDDDRRGPDTERAPAAPAWEISGLVVDAGLWSYSDMWDAGWDPSELTTGTQANITPLMVDGDREDPTLATSPRGSDPIGTATSAFITALDLPEGPKVSTGSAITDRPLLAEVYSQPVSVLVGQMLQLNDHTLADMLARLASKTIGSDGSAASLDQMYRSVLTEYGVPTEGLVVKDGSGLNPETAANPEYVARLLAVIVAGEPTLHRIQAAMPVAGVSGPLMHRFSGELATVHTTFVGTGSATGEATTLGGLMTAADGSILTVSLQSTGAVSGATSLALESLVAAIHACGDNLANAEPPTDR
jgi:D-alanyl-D-alanine carboxypeptidase/D-alanyl-D-alanine-endopeptidase (penicillin-binding protein 4)